MLLRLIRFVKAMIQTFHQEDSPRLVALGCALGMMVGLTPKGNLTALLLGVLILSIRLNLVAAALSTGVFSSVAAWTDPLAHRIGHAILTRESLQPYWSRCYELPFAPWTGLNNTVVTGSLLLGLAMCYPVYHLTRLSFERYRAAVVAKIARCKAAKMLTAADTAVSWRIS